jgi:transposase
MYCIPEAPSKKTVCSVCGTRIKGFRDRRRDNDTHDTKIFLEFEYRRVYCPMCKGIKRETLTWLASSARFTQRYEDRVGRLCRDMSIKRVAEEHRLSWDQVRRMDMAYMRRLEEANPISLDLRAIGIDEISVKRGHDYRIVVADLDRKKPIWIGGDGRREEDMNQFFDLLGPERCAKLELAVMDMWKPFRKATLAKAGNARIIYDKFHILKHLGTAMDEVRRSEYKRVNDSDIRFLRTRRT